jgi:hypothetical protein
VRLDTNIPRLGTAALFLYTPHLSTLQIDLPDRNTHILHYWLDFYLVQIPHLVTEVVYSGFGYNVGFYASLLEELEMQDAKPGKK